MILDGTQENLNTFDMKTKLLLLVLTVVMMTGCKDEFKTDPSGTFTDKRDKKEYKWVKIGDQIWMAENLAYLPSVNKSSEGSETFPLYYVADYEDSNVSVAKQTSNYQNYGVLYNWEAAKIACPIGWHLPTDAEWSTLADFLGTNVGFKMREAGTAHWQSPNYGATNESGFTALPGGHRYHPNGFHDLGIHGNFWSSTAEGSSNAWFRYLQFNDEKLGRSGDFSRHFGFSVRCMKD